MHASGSRIMVYEHLAALRSWGRLAALRRLMRLAALHSRRLLRRAANSVFSHQALRWLADFRPGPLPAALCMALALAGLSQMAWRADEASLLRTDFVSAATINSANTSAAPIADGADVAGGTMLSLAGKAAQLLSPSPASGLTEAAPAAMASATTGGTPAARGVGPGWLHFDVRRGETFNGLLNRANIAGDEVQSAVEALRSVYNPKALKAGQRISVNFTADLGFKGFEFQPDDLTKISVSRDLPRSLDFSAAKKDVPLSIERFAAAGQISSSLSAAAADAKVPASVLSDIIRAYSYTVDFQRDIQPGDRFAVMYERAMTESGVATGKTALLFASLTINGREMPIYRHKLQDGRFEMFDHKGQSIRKGLLRTPIDGARISSGFGSRIHPILGYSKMHKGVDFAAARGTPIFAAGDGVVDFAGNKGAYGRLITLRHRSDLQTAYAHLSKFASGIRVGSRVQQGQVIGYVGTSGRSTGPHLHYEVRLNGKAKDPLRVTLPSSRKLDGKDLNEFKQVRGVIDAELARLLSQQSNTAQEARL